ncbi:hypothetical protein FACS1894123_04920 [Bacteroidia bacterium]|nr:hypothetical protein FACS1894123_04920 [Bacteroidia bacterium]
MSAYNKEGKSVGRFRYSVQISNHTEINVDYIYVDGDVSITGSGLIDGEL